MIGGTDDELRLVALALDVLVEHLDTRRRARPALLDDLRSTLGAVLSRPEPSSRDIAAEVGERAPDMAPLLLKYDDAAELLRSSTSTVERLVRDGKLPVVHIGRSAFIRPDDLAACVAALPATNCDDLEVVR